MQFQVKKRDGPARIGELTLMDKKIITPNILFIDTNRFKAPGFADLLITNTNCKTTKPSFKISDYFFYPKELELSELKIEKKENNIYYIVPGNKNLIDNISKNNSSSIFIVANAFQLLQQPKKFVDFIVELRKKIGYQKIIYAPRIGNPSSFALLAYIGIDFFDSISAIIAARNDVLFFENGKYHKNKLNELPCNCPSCIRNNSKPSDMSFEEILAHNYNEIIKEIKKVRNAISNGELRALAETRVKTDPNLTTILRNLDNDNYSFLESNTAIVKKEKILATTKESLQRPEIKRFQERIINRYKKPDVAKVLLLLPCSAKKPYSFSKSHKLFREKLLSSNNPHVVHEVIITSPIGLVPRELELIYPASNYDIPVTGIWDEDEKKMIRTLLLKYLEKNKYDKIISHLPDELMDFLEDILKESSKTCIGRPTSDESLEKLSKVLVEIVSSFQKIKPSKKTFEEIYGLTSYQFGKKTSKNLLENCEIRGKYPYLKIMDGKKQIGMLTKERGLISLTLDGAKRLINSNMYWVKIDNDFEVIGSIFAPGVIDADENIRIGDEVIILKNNMLCGVGVAQMNGEQMKNLTYGEAVKVRHKI